MMDKINAAAGHDLEWGYLSRGALAVVGANVTIDDPAHRPAAARGCATREFTSASA
jgi:hypothetical protein